MRKPGRLLKITILVLALLTVPVIGLRVMMAKKHAAPPSAVEAPKPAAADSIAMMLADTSAVHVDSAAARVDTRAKTVAAVPKVDTKPAVVPAAPAAPAPAAAATTVAAASKPAAPKPTAAAHVPSFVIMRNGKEVLHDFTRAPEE